METEHLLPAEGGQSDSSDMTGSNQLPARLSGLYKVYRRRWLMLAIFTLYSVANAAQWIQYSIISNVIQRYYGVSSYAVDWTSIVYMITFPPFIFPASAFLERMGLRKFVIIGAFGTSLGSWIKCGSIAPDRFWVTLIGQTIVATCQVFILGVPPHLASVWFGSEQVSTACSLAVFGNQLGVAAGFVLTPLAVTNHPNLEDVGADLARMNYVVAGFCTAVFVLVVILFQEKPPLPPSLEMLRRDPVGPSFLQPLKRLFTNPGYMLLSISFSINVAVFSALSTLLNQLMLLYFDNAEVFAGRVGLIFVLSGMAGSVVCGIILDRTHWFKETSVVLYVVSTLSMLALTFILSYRSQMLVYGVSVILGAFTGAFMPVGFEFASELTYPETESTTAGVMVAASQVLGVLVTMGYACLMDLTGDVWANVTLAGILVLGILFTVLIPPRLRRQAAHAAALKEVDDVTTAINA
ncbi:heme transporter FLVCR2 [Anabrus simplex]|uniref:heme transporter FLVCR2 n=1 Tax=Anabrus simplex TaxID=316456 RepID=UPI0035A337E8